MGPISAIEFASQAATRMHSKPLRRFRLPQAPLARLLLINLAIGAAVGLLWVGGLLLLNPGGLRQLILADCSPGLAVALLLGVVRHHPARLQWAPRS